ncbi:biotin synthetase [Escherichia coli]|uniref:Biotin synthetase n=1 Tax=Escherichia coli TaxID=562 RepID=A0A377DIU7_ECOLX|nr:biotin synthetase [Escherichia coli]
MRTPGWITTNHNLDTSPEFYGNIITTRTYQERLDTLEKVRDAGIKVCSGGIVGLGETVKDRAGLLLQLANPADAAGKRANQHAGEGERHTAGG